MTFNAATLPRTLLTINATILCSTPFIADWNHTHIYNPRWPPHAKFHNGQTMSMAVCLSFLSLYYTWAPSANADENDALNVAAVIGGTYWITGLSAILYPGSKAIDPEFADGFPEFPQFWPWVGLLGMCAWAWWLA